MEHIGKQLAKIDQNIKINSADPVALHGFTQVPNFILKNPDISIGAKTTYALFLSYAWQQLVLPRSGHACEGDRHEHRQCQRLHQGAADLWSHRDNPARAGQDQSVHHQLRCQAQGSEVLISAR